MERARARERARVSACARAPDPIDAACEGTCPLARRTWTAACAFEQPRARHPKSLRCLPRPPRSRVSYAPNPSAALLERRAQVVLDEPARLSANRTTCAPRSGRLCGEGSIDGLVCGHEFKESLVPYTVTPRVFSPVSFGLGLRRDLRAVRLVSEADVRDQPAVDDATLDELILEERGPARDLVVARRAARAPRVGEA